MQQLQPIKKNNVKKKKVKKKKVQKISGFKNFFMNAGAAACSKFSKKKKPLQTGGNSAFFQTQNVTSATNGSSDFYANRASLVPGNAHVSLVTHPGVKPEKADDKLIAVIVTVLQGSSYDDIFRKVPQEANKGECVHTYQCNIKALAEIKASLASWKAEIRSKGVGLLWSWMSKREGRSEGRGSLPCPIRTIASFAWGAKATKATSPASPSLAPALPVPQAAVAMPQMQLITDIQAMDADAVVFNFECCSSCSDSGFHDCGAPSPSCVELIAFLLQQGHMVMCSDFSLKALIAKWDEQLLGPNPFVKIGGFSGNMTYQFEADTLKDCCSAQLQKVGELCGAKGASCHALSDTIVYALDPGKAKTDRYSLEVLTVALEITGFDIAAACKTHGVAMTQLGKHRGSLGHTVLTYPTGGQLLTSAGHWIELSKVDVDTAKLLEVAKKSYGAATNASLSRSLAACSNKAEEQQWQQKWSHQFIQCSAPVKKKKGY